MNNGKQAQGRQETEQQMTQYTANVRLTFGDKVVHPGEQVPYLHGRDYAGMAARGEIVLNAAAQQGRAVQGEADTLRRELDEAQRRVTDLTARLALHRGERVYVVAPATADDEHPGFYPAEVTATGGGLAPETVQVVRIVQPAEGEGDEDAVAEDEAQPQWVPVSLVVRRAAGEPLHGLLLAVVDELGQVQAELDDLAAKGGGEDGAVLLADALAERDALKAERDALAEQLAAVRSAHTQALGAVGVALGGEGSRWQGAARITKALKGGGFDTDEAVQFATDEELLALPDFAERSLSEVRAVLPHVPSAPAEATPGEGGGDDDQGGSSGAQEG